MRGLGAALCTLLLVLAGPVLARDITKAERKELVERIDSFNAAMAANDQAELLSVVPPPVLEAQAEANGITVEQLVAQAKTAMEQALADVEIVSFDMALEAARYEELADGTPYVTIPTETVMRINGDRIRASGDTLAMLDDGIWYLVRVSEAAQVDILKQVYPGFAKVDFPAGTVEDVE